MIQFIHSCMQMCCEFVCVHMHVCTHVSSRHSECYQVYMFTLSMRPLIYVDAANSLHQPTIISYTEFYNTALDHTDLMAEYYAWQSPQGHATM